MNETLQSETSSTRFKCREESDENFMVNIQLWTIGTFMEFSSAVRGLNKFSLCISVASPKECSNRIEFNVVVAGGAFSARQNDFLYALRVSNVGRFEFIALGHDAPQAVNL